MASSILSKLLLLPTLQLGTLLSESWDAARGRSRYTDVPPLEPSLMALMESTLDRSFTLGLNIFSGMPDPDTIRRGAEELTAALALYRDRGWLDDPRAYHVDPPPLRDVEIEATSQGSGSREEHYAHLRFASEYAPRADEPGAQRWLDLALNRTAHAYLLEHPGEPRPWVLCVHGFGMGDTRSTFSGFGSRWLHEELGLNVAFYVLPLHGPRSGAQFSGGEMMSPDYTTAVQIFAQAVWEIRRLIRWLREERLARQVGLYGISLGGYTASLVAGLEPGLGCVVAGIPAVDFSSLSRDNEPWLVRAYGASPELDVDWDLVRAATYVVSPLTFDPLLPVERRFIFAGTGDRVTRPSQARALWRHWDRPEIHWFPSGHVAAMWKRSARDFVARALAKSGFLDGARATSS